MQVSHVFEKVDQLELFKAHADGIEAAFLEFHKENPQVYSLLVKFARQAKYAGRKKFGMKMLFERVRWYTEIETSDPTGLKINNNFTAYYARLVMKQERCTKECTGCERANCLAGLFELRELHASSTLEQAA